jgi:hypothetical protein
VYWTPQTDRQVAWLFATPSVTGAAHPILSAVFESLQLEDAVLHRVRACMSICGLYVGRYHLIRCCSLRWWRLCATQQPPEFDIPVDCGASSLCSLRFAAALRQYGVSALNPCTDVRALESHAGCGVTSQKSRLWPVYGTHAVGRGVDVLL